MRIFTVFFCCALALGQQGVASQWAGEGGHRIVVVVAPVDIGDRASDELPARVDLDLMGMVNRLGQRNRKVDLSSIQVVRLDERTGEPQEYHDNAYAGGPFDRPWRWYDASIPDEFPEVLTPVSRTDGELRRTDRLRAGYFYNTLGDGEEGYLAWVHTQQGRRPARYAIYFDLLPPGESMSEMPPSGWLGDGMPRTDRYGDTTTGSGHTRIALDDWNDNGLIDIIHGEEYGRLFVIPNVGTPQEPRYTHRRMLFDADGLPLDVGTHAAPLVVDLDGDGVKDLLVGTHHNRVVFFRNEGTNADRKLVYKGFIRTEDGEPLMLPTTPVVGRSEAIFREDYYPVLAAVDWNGNGRLDLIAGGYITGRLFFYENIGTDGDGLPVLRLRGPLEADGQPINVGDWCAAPAIADFNGNGRLDLISGNMPMTPQSSADSPFLRYYENSGTPAEPILSERPLPRTGEFPRGGLATPRAADLTGNGLLDLVVSAGQNIYIFRNAGTPEQPLFEVHNDPIRIPWGNAKLPGRRFIDYNGNGLPDSVSNYTVLLNSGEGNPWFFRERVNVLPPGVHIAHPSGVGDDWFWPYLYDFTGDGRMDVLFGDWWGHIWLHRNQSDGETAAFDLEGERLRTTDGELIKVGPEEDPEASFQALQGARTVFTVADFSGDGLNDLVIGDTFGIVRYYRNVASNEQPVFAAPVEVGDLGIRLLVDAADWNGNGRMDIVAGAANGRVQIFLNTGREGAERFEEGFDPGLPPIRQPRVVMVDLNGDGDQDLFIPSTQGSVWIERSFLEHGYAQGRVIRVESR